MRKTVMGGLLATLLVTAASAAPIEITDAAGRKVVVDGPVTRVVTTFNYDEFSAIAGASGWERVVGYSRYVWADWRPSIWKRYVDAIPRIGTLPDVGNIDDASFAAEKLIALRPQAVILPQWAFDSLRTAVDQMAAANIPVVVIDYNAQNVERHAASTLAIGKLMGTTERASALADLYRREVAEVQRRVAQATAGTRPKVYLELGQQGPEVYGNTYATTMWGRMFDLAGVDNIAKGRIPGALGPINPELILATDPDAIFLAGSTWTNQPKAVRMGYDVPIEVTRATLATYLTRPGWSGLKAVKSGNVHALQHGLARTLMDFTALQYIAKALYPDQFRDVDPIENLRKYHEAWLPVTYDGTWMVALNP